MAAQPSLWQQNLGPAAGDAAAAVAPAVPVIMPADSDEKLSTTWQHIVAVAGSEAKAVDLMDLLSGARREDTYQFPVPGWPSLLRAVSPTTPDLPAMVQDKYRTCQTMCFCGVFPEIRRAWASVDNSLFLWRYDRSGDVPVEYSGEEQAICCVGLAKPKPNVFLSAIQHILVLATPVEIVLLGVCISTSPAGGDQYEQLSLQPMPLYSLPSDNVLMTCFAASASGRLFMGGADGHVYEIRYEATDNWRRRRCSKVRITGGLQQMLPSFLPNLLFGPPVPLERLVLDDERHILYTLAANNALTVFDLGAAGDEPPRKAAELPNYLEQVTRLAGGRQQVFGPGDDKRTTSLKYLAVVPMAESWKIHLVAVTANGRRVYFTTAASISRGGPGEDRDMFKVPARYDPRLSRPATLVAVDARGPLPQAPVAGVRAAADPNSRVLDVTAALYSHGSLLLAESSGPDGKATQLLLAARNYTLPPPSTNVNTASSSVWLREVVSELGQLVPGETTAIGCLPQPSQLGPDVHPGGSWGAMQNELVGQMFSGPPQLVLVSTAGVLELERRRPVDVLQELLTERSADKLKQFFEAYGPAEAAAMCYLLATSDKQSMSLVHEAASALDNPLLVGQPALQEDLGGPDSNQSTRGAEGGMYMGAPVNPHPEPQWSGCHRGLALYVSRLLAPVWDRRLITPSRDNNKVWKARLTDTTMMVLERKLRALDAFLLDAADRRRARGFKADGTGTALGGPAAAAAAAAGSGGLFGAAGGSGLLEDGSNRLNAAAGAALAGGGFGGGGGGGSGLAVGGVRGPLGAAGAPAAKRQRMFSAALYEEQRNNAIRLLASKAAQALFLLRTLTAANVNRLVLRLGDDSRRRLRDLAFRDLVEGSLATELVTAYLSDQLEGSSGAPTSFSTATSSVSELAAVLQRHAPAFFRDQDRQFFQAAAKLAAAEGAGSATERDALVSEALTGLLAVPQCVNLAEFVPRLAFLRQYKGVVSLVVKVAQLSDPHSLAARQGGTADIAAARTARDRAYQHMLGVLKPLLQGAAPLAAPVGAAAAAAAAAGDGQGGAGARSAGTPLTAAEVRAAKETIIQAILSSKDEYLITVLHATLVDVRADADLLQYHGPGLEMYLLREGGMSGQAGFGGAGASWLSDTAIGPLTPSQVRHLGLLARLQAQKRRFSIAAGVYNALATRLSGPGSSAVSLEERLDAFQEALMQASSSGDKQVVEQLRASVDLIQLQITIANNIARIAASSPRDAAGASSSRTPQRAPPTPGTGAAALPDGITPARAASDVRALRSRCLDIDTLYNTYAQPYAQWDMCLCLCDCANTVPGEYVRQLWDLLLKQAWEEGGAAGVDGRPASSDMRLAQCCQATQELGQKFYPNDNSLPLLHVTLRLEAIAAGLWPQPADPADDTTRVVSCLRGCISATAKDSTSGVVAGVYEQLLAKRGPLLEDAVAGAGVVLGGTADGGGRTTLRLRLLASLAAHCRLVMREELGPGLVGQPDMGYPGPFLGRANQAAALADLAERCASEARGLATSGQHAAAARALAEEFEALVDELGQQQQ